MLYTDLLLVSGSAHSVYKHVKICNVNYQLFILLATSSTMLTITESVIFIK